MNDFINALFNTSTPETVTAYFKDGTYATYTTAILDFLKTDKDVTEITSDTTGEIIFAR